MIGLSISKLKKLNRGGKVSQNVNFANLCTFKCGGRVKVLLDIHTLDGFLNCMLYLKDIKMPYYILGNGSNVLCSDKGYDGVVIRLCGDLSRIEYDGDILECGAGAKLAGVFSYARDKELSGLECGAGIPATIGGATYMNAGAFGWDMSQVIEYVVAYVDGKIRYFDSVQCEFSYRHSVFQNNGGIILRVGLKLVKGKREDIVARFLETMKKRKDTQPLEYPSAGSVFCRMEGVNISKMLDECGVKGLTRGNAMVSTKHANFIVNMGGARSQDIYDLICKIKKIVFEKTGTKIYTEIKFLGEFDENTW